jgi:hypothetical protein
MIFPNLLLIAGTGNKSGKTTLACRIIEQFRDLEIVGIKITPHFHETTPGLILLSERKGYSLYEETNTEINKDTSRMLKAGAIRVFFAKVSDSTLLRAFNEIFKLIPDGAPIVCESPALRHHVVPGLFVIMKSDEAGNNKNINQLLQLPHVMIHLNELQGMDTFPVSFDGNRWLFNPLSTSR